MARHDTSKYLWVMVPEDALPEYEQGQYIVVDPEINPSEKREHMVIRRHNKLKIIASKDLNHATDTLIGHIVGKFGFMG